MKRADGAAFADVDVRAAVVGVIVDRAEARGSKAPVDGIKVDGESAFEVGLAEVEIETNGIAIAAVDVDSGAAVGEFVVGILCTDVVPPGFCAEDGRPEIIGAADIGAADGVEDQSENAAAAVISNRSTDGGLARCEVETEGPDVIAQI